MQPVRSKSARVELWEIDLTEVGGERYFSVMSRTKKVSRSPGRGGSIRHTHSGAGFELNGRGCAARPTLTVSNLHGMVTGMAEDLQSLVGGTVVRRKVLRPFSGCGELRQRKQRRRSGTGGDQPLAHRAVQRTERGQCLFCAGHTNGDGWRGFPGAYHAGDTCMWTYRSDECGYTGRAVADEFDKPTTDIRKDKCSKCMRGCELRNNTGNFGGFLSINKLSQ